LTLNLASRSLIVDSKLNTFTLSYYDLLPPYFCFTHMIKRINIRLGSDAALRH
jgi:hypothetical protein